MPVNNLSYPPDNHPRSVVPELLTITAASLAVPVNNLSYPPDNHPRSDVVYWRDGRAKQQQKHTIKEAQIAVGV